jgi:hypothetical protein
VRIEVSVSGRLVEIPLSKEELKAMPFFWSWISPTTAWVIQQEEVR